MALPVTPEAIAMFLEEFKHDPQALAAPLPMLPGIRFIVSDAVARDEMLVYSTKQERGETKLLSAVKVINIGKTNE